MRMVVIKQPTDVAALSKQLLTAQLSAGQKAAALETLRRLNPHVDLASLRAGTVLLVPDATAFQPSASTSPLDDVLAEIDGLVKTELDNIAARAKTAQDARSAETAEITRVVKTAALKRVIDADPTLKPDLDAAVNALKKDSADTSRSVQAVADARDRALTALKELSDVLVRSQ